MLCNVLAARVVYDEIYLNFIPNLIANACADCDKYYDKKGCGAGLVCGNNNCARFHEIGGSTGLKYYSNCCECK